MNRLGYLPILYFRLIIICVVIGIGSTTYANLLDVGNGVIWDNTTDKYWFQDLTQFVDMTFDEQLNEIATLNIAASHTGNSWGDWRMATVNELSDLLYDDQGWDYPILEQVSELFNPTSGNDLWLGRAAFHLPPQSYLNHCSPLLADYGADIGGRSFMVEIYGNVEYDYTRSDSLGAWVVAEGRNPYPPIPEPGTLLFMGTGIVVLAGLRRKKLF